MSRLTRRRNFTLVELLTVVAIIGVLVGIVMGLMSMATGKMTEARTKSLISQISVALESYKAKYGYYVQQPVAYAFYLDVVTSGASSGEEYISNNFCQFIDYQTILNKDTTRVTTSSVPSSSNKAWLVDGYGNPMIYRCPGYFNRNGFDLGSLGSDGKFGNLSSGGVAYNLDGSTATKETVSNGYQAQFGKGDDVANFTR